MARDATAVKALVALRLLQRGGEHPRREHLGDIKQRPLQRRHRDSVDAGDVAGIQVGAGVAANPSDVVPSRSGDVDVAAAGSAQAVEGGCVPVAEHRLRATRKNGCHPLPLERQLGMADSVNAAVAAMKAARVRSPLHRMAPIPKGVQLRHGDHAVLPRGELGQTCVI